MTRAQSNVYMAIAKFISKNGYSPSYAEIGKATGLRSLSAVFKHVHALENQGYIQMKKGRKPAHREMITKLRSMVITKLADDERYYAGVAAGK